MHQFTIENPALRFFEKVGRVVVEFGRLEYLIKLCLKDLLGEGFTEGMAKAESIRQFRAICREAKARGKEELSVAESESFSARIDQALELADYRNSVVHACWTALNSEPLRIRPNWDKKTKSVRWDEGRVVTVDELQAKADEIESLWRKLQQERRVWGIRLGD